MTPELYYLIVIFVVTNIVSTIFWGVQVAMLARRTSADVRRLEFDWKLTELRSEDKWLDVVKQRYKNEEKYLTQDIKTLKQWEIRIIEEEEMKRKMRSEK